MFVCVVWAALPACRGRAERPERRLPSGRVIRDYSLHVDRDRAEWTLFYRTGFTVAARERGPLQCELDALWAELREEVEASGATRATFAPTHFEIRPRLVGWRAVILGDVTVFVERERDASGVWKKTEGWTVEECGTGTGGG